MEYRPYYLAREWIKQGNTVTIVAATQSHIRTHNPEFKKKITEEHIDSIKYIWIKTRAYTGNGIGRIFNMFDYITGIYAMMPRLIEENPDAVIASSTYPLDNYPAYTLAKKSKAKYVYEVHDLWPLSPMELGGYSKYHPFILLMQKAENFAYTHADKVVSILPCAKQHMIDHGLEENKFCHIPNGISLEEKKDIEVLDEKIKALIPEDKFIIGYIGTFGLANSLGDLLESASILKKQCPEISFVLIGKGSEKDSLVALQKKMQLNNLVIIESIPKKQVQSVLKMFDACIITWRKQSLYQFGVSPNKIFDYMYAGKPVIQAIEAGNDIVADAKCGITVEPENPQAIAEGISTLFNMKEGERKTLGENGRKHVLENHVYEKLAKDFLISIYPPPIIDIEFKACCQTNTIFYRRNAA
jgi:glycosyltransferase involved in cell wall biosynthesis